MTSAAKPGDARTTSTPQRRVSLRVVLGGAIAVVALAAIAGVESGALRWPGHDDAAPEREASAARPPSPAAPPAVHAAAPRPALPRASPGEPPPTDRANLDAITGEDKRTRTHIKVDRYVNEAYPAWLRAHPGQECPRRLSELDEYIHEPDAKDAWGRSLRMLCGAARWGGAKRIEVMSLGRDGEARTEDDIEAED